MNTRTIVVDKVSRIYIGEMAELVDVNLSSVEVLEIRLPASDDLTGMHEEQIVEWGIAYLESYPEN